MKKFLILIALCILSCGKTGASLDAGTIAKDQTSVVSVDFGYQSGTKLVHVVGVQAVEAEATETTIGKAAVVTSLPDDALCTVVLDAKIGTRVIPNGKESILVEVPDLPSCLSYFGKDMWPIRLTGSDMDKSWIWYTLLRGQGCAEIVNCAGAAYLGSSIKEFFALPDTAKRRFLKTMGKCGGTDCVVPIGDAKATVGAKIFFPMELAGRYDLNYTSIENGLVKDRYPSDAVKEEPVVDAIP